ncbi:MAG TPA: hypothetical protein VG675_01855 [Bryobacteraceae bacterium]|nr:hypothetical protein [Bryobacteraceae bacterium]
MRSEDERHLTPEQIDLAAGMQDAPAEVTAHLESCPQCAEAADASRRFRAQLHSLRAGKTSLRGTECPATEELAQLAGGELSVERVDWLLEHIAGCDYCGAMLEAALGSAALRDSDLQMLQQLRTAEPNWQHRTGLAYARSRRWAWRAGCTGSAVAAAILAALVASGATRWIAERDVSDSERLIAGARAVLRPLTRAAGAVSRAARGTRLYGVVRGEKQYRRR